MARDAIVILGAAVWEGGVPSPTLKCRIETACAAANRMPSALIICSGGLGRFPPAEAELMQSTLVRMGVRPDRILIEGASHTTLENALFSIQLMKDHQATRAIVVTDAYHVLRSVITFRALGMPAVAIASPRDRKTPIRRYLWYWLREVAALPVYLLKVQQLRRRKS